jgi:hypothetical protein
VKLIQVDLDINNGDVLEGKMGAQNNKDLVKAINRDWLTELEKDTSLCGILMNEPFSDEYWSENYKIVFCNLESYDQSRDEKILDLNCIKIWLEKKSRTIKRSILFLYSLVNCLQGNDIDKNKIQAVKNDNKQLLAYLKKVTYMNLLKDANGKSRFDKKYFNDFFSNDENIKNTIALINALSPDIFVVTSDAGCDLIEKLFKNKFKDHMFVYNNTLFVGLGHPSRCFTDDYIINSVKLIMENLIKK